MPISAFTYFLRFSLSVSVKMVDKDKRDIDVYDFSQRIKNEIMRQIPGVRARVTVTSMGGADSVEPIQLIVQGADFEKVQSAANRVMDVFRRTPGTTDVKFSTDDSRQEVQIKLDRAKMTKMGLSAADVGSALRVALAGNDDSKFTDRNYEYNIRIGIDNFDRTNAEDVARLTILNRRGELIELSQIDDVAYGLGVSTLERVNRIASITVKSNVTGRPAGTVGNEVMTALEGQTPDGVSILVSGIMERQSSAFGSLGYAFLAAIIIIYLIMVVMYNSLLDSVIVRASIPLALIGAFLTLALTMNDLNIFTIIGLIVLIGLVRKTSFC
jgi:HAE1 family hydrophobic/amphiphilic exporter-1